MTPAVGPKAASCTTAPPRKSYVSLHTIKLPITPMTISIRYQHLCISLTSSAFECLHKALCGCCMRIRHAPVSKTDQASPLPPPATQHRHSRPGSCLSPGALKRRELPQHRVSCPRATGLLALHCGDVRAATRQRTVLAQLHWQGWSFGVAVHMAGKFS
jgi:hypothetical protein